jgi:hypothetical protein
MDRLDQNKQMVDFLVGAKKVEIILQTYICVYLYTDSSGLPLLLTIDYMYSGTDAGSVFSVADLDPGSGIRDPGLGAF